MFPIAYSVFPIDLFPYGGRLVPPCGGPVEAPCGGSLVVVPCGGPWHRPAPAATVPGDESDATWLPSSKI